MIYTVCHVGAVPLGLCHEGRARTAYASILLDLHTGRMDGDLPDLVTSNTPPPSPPPGHTCRFFPPGDPCPDLLPQGCQEGPLTPHSETQGRAGVVGREGGDPCQAWGRTGAELRLMADSFSLRQERNRRHSHATSTSRSTTTTTTTTVLSRALGLSLLCLVSWKVLQKLRLRVPLS